MKWFHNLKIGKKLTMSFLFVALVAGALGVYGVIEIRSTDERYSELYQIYGVSESYLVEISEAFQKTRINMRETILDTNPEYQQQKRLEVTAFEKIVNDNLDKFEATLVTDEDFKLFNELKQSWLVFTPFRDQVLNLSKQGNSEGAYALIRGEGMEITQKMNTALRNLVDMNIRVGLETSKNYSEETNKTVVYMMVIVAVGVLIALALGLLISRLISRPLASLVTAAERIADGDLNIDVNTNTKDEIGILSQAFDRMANNLNEVMDNISSASEQVASGSKQVSDSSMALSQGATEQASSVEELTASLEEISEQTKLNAVSADEANKLAIHAKSNAMNGNQQMMDMLKAMEEINDSSSNISKIIKVIDEIAFQTNILALNAAVEAARAGQHGKGFAVVAEEVRNLAARSANAAKETTDMIEGSIKKVEGGTKIAKETAEALNLIVEGVTKVASLVGDIAVASNEQAAGIAQVNQGIMQVSQVVQTNSATSEESAAASEELASQAELLQEQVSRFKLKRGGRRMNKYVEGPMNQDMLRMIDQLQDRLKNQDAATVRSKKIVLSDNEFGKY